MMKAWFFIATALLCGAMATEAVAQSGDVPLPPGGDGAEMAPASPEQSAGATGDMDAARVFGSEGTGEPPAEFAMGAEKALGYPVYGYQFCYGSFSFGGQPRGIFSLSSHQFPQGYVQKLYDEQLRFVWFYPSGPYQGALFRCTVNGRRLYILFGTYNLGWSNGVALRKLSYYDGYGRQLYSTCARFYTP